MITYTDTQDSCSIHRHTHHMSALHSCSYMNTAPTQCHRHLTGTLVHCNHRLENNRLICEILDEDL
jgi:hypothetical protein